MQIDDLILVSVDDHVVEPAGMFERHLPERWRDRAPRIVQADPRFEALIPRGDGPNGRHVSLAVYWALTIPAGCTQEDLAWEFLRHVGSPAMDLVTAYEGAIGCRLSTWRGRRESMVWNECGCRAVPSTRLPSTIPPVLEKVDA
jgi:hypothetical protein